MPNPATSPRKPKPKVRALKEHKPRLYVDVEQAGALLKETAELNRKLLCAQDKFMDLVRWPVSRAVMADGIDADVKDMLDAVKDSMSAFLMRSARQRDEAENLMTAALASLRILRAHRLGAVASGGHVEGQPE